MNQVLNLAKVLSVHEDKNGEHSWVKSAINPKKISYVSVLITTYTPGQNVTYSCLNPKSPAQYTFSLIRGTHIAYVYSPSLANHFDLIAPGSYSIPEKLLLMLRLVNIPKWIQQFENHVTSKGRKRLTPP